MKYRIGLNVICTRNYHIYLNQLLGGVRDNFFRDDEVHVFLFTDRERDDLVPGITVHQKIIPSYGFPEASMMRFDLFGKSRLWYAEHAIDFLYFMDVDLEVVSPIGREALPTPETNGLVAVQHARMWFAEGTWDDNPECNAYVPPAMRSMYYVGGVYGGSFLPFVVMCDVLAEMTRQDLDNGITAKWHDESYTNMYFAYSPPKELPPTYCWPPEQPPELKEAGFTDPKVVCIVKSKEIRGNDAF